MVPLKVTKRIGGLAEDNRNMLSAVIVTFNEAEYLPDCLNSLKFCDELVVVDIGSTDNSRGIAEKHGARVIEHEWVPYAEKIRPFLLEQARFEWILFSDPDMEYLPALGQTLLDTIKSDSDGTLGAIYVPHVTYFGRKALNHGRKSGRRPFLCVVHRDRYFFTGQIHHRGGGLKPGFRAVDYRYADVEPIRHFWVRSIKEAKAKALRYIPFDAQERLERGERIRFHRLIWRMIYAVWFDMSRKAFMSRNAMKVWLFHEWYLWKLYLQMRQSSRGTGDDHRQILSGG